ncbi:MAG TPA: DUF5011 domain-containing protein [Mollicutes bacterium]|nr:DUF5011 domain-containing protein [Mollicutes bacterium]
MKKGFTLVELLAVIVILVILSSLVIPSVFKMIRNAKENSYNILIDSFENNARLYVSRHRDEIEKHLDTYNYYSLSLNDLKEDNLLKLPVKDPRSDEEIDLTKKIFVVRETKKTLSICYEDRGCYAPIFLVDKLTESTNVVSGTTPGLHFNYSNNTYYYRGLNPKNWIEFNDSLWRIVKINNDDSIKIIYEGKRKGEGTEQNGNIGNGTFDNSNTNEYKSSVSIATRLQNWYNSNISENNKAKVQTNKWCVGKIGYSTSGVTKSTFLNNECVTQTTNLSIGLLNGSDYLYASLDNNCLTAYKTSGDNGISCKNDNYLYKNFYNYWTLTPDNNSTKVWTVNSVGSLGAPVDANTTIHTRPVINLKGNIYIDRGTGEFDNPYVIKDIVSVDREKPVITLLGDNLINLYVGEEYVDAGATAIDNVDGDITDKIIKISNLNINKPGTYKIEYVVSDFSGNKTSIKRIIDVREKSIANAPILAEGMIPIKWNGTTWVNTSLSDSEWYNYDEMMWANAKTADGSMWVWIPRYIYRITSGWHSSSTGTIEVQFSKGIDDTLGGTVTLVNTGRATDSNGTWTSHPAFTFGGVELTGIWVGKFESSNDGSNNVKIVPGVISWRYISVNNIFNKVRSMETNSIYGWGTSGNGIDTHMMKNTEWGAVAYLSKSQYGNPNEIWNNSNTSNKTGCAGSGVNATNESICNEYHTTDGVKASTTGNITGIYDMSGGAWEYLSAYVDNSHVYLTVYGESAYISHSKYKDVYEVAETDNQTENYKLTISSKGDALYETSNVGTGSTSWYGDYSYMANNSNPWFIRGGYYGSGASAGPFNFEYFMGAEFGGGYGFRAVLSVGEGL